MPQDWNYGTDRLGGASMALGSGWRGFERNRLISSVTQHDGIIGRHEKTITTPHCDSHECCCGLRLSRCSVPPRLCETGDHSFPLGGRLHRPTSLSCLRPYRIEFPSFRSARLVRAGLRITFASTSQMSVIALISTVDSHCRPIFWMEDLIILLKCNAASILGKYTEAENSPA